MARESFVFYESFLEAVRLIPNAEDRAAALMAIVEYGCGEEPEVDGVAAAILAMAKPNIDSASKRREAGAKGGRPKVSNANNHRLSDMKTIGYEDAKPMVTDSGNHRLADAETNVDVDEDVDVDGEEENNAPAREDSLNDPADILCETPEETKDRQVQDIAKVIGDQDMAKALTNWIEVRQTIGPYPYGAITECLDAAKRAKAKHGASKCIEAIKRATAGAWKNIRWEELETARSGTPRKCAWAHDNERTDIDWEALDG